MLKKKIQIAKDLVYNLRILLGYTELIEGGKNTNKKLVNFFKLFKL